MPHRLSRIYTRSGDAGETGLADGSRLAKDETRLHCLGELDELNSQLGVLLSLQPPAEWRPCLEEIQHTLFDLGGDLSLPGRHSIGQAQVEWLERWLDHANAGLPPLAEFILPGGNPAAAACHVARCVCRRCERQLTPLLRQGQLSPAAYAYINRLSDLLFVLARLLARREGGEVLWRHGRVPPLPGN
jgi:cob(I)alamin adenosyltransferase